MEWRDEGMILAVRPHGEQAAIVELLTRAHGRHAGVVHGGASRRMAPLLQPGNQVSAEWRARLEEHLGTFRLDLLRSRSAVLDDRRRLAALTSLCALSCFGLPERMPMPGFYAATMALADALAEDAGDWPAIYTQWEFYLLESLGYGLDLESCAATGAREALVWVSPKSGRAVSAEAGAPWADRLLRLPAFLRDHTAPAGESDVLDALRLTGHFLEHWLAPALGDRPLPAARARLVAALARTAKG